MDIISAIHNEHLFKKCFRDLSTWKAWLLLLKALFGLSMDERDFALYRRCTGRTEPPKKGFKELWAIVGRRGGKSFISAIVAVFLALFVDYKKYLAPGERGVVLVIAADRSQAQTILSYAKGILNVIAVFKQYIQTELKESIELSNGISIEVASCSFRLTRGRTVVCAIFDEVAFWRVEGANPDKEILAAVRPAMATIPNSILIVISSPYARYGVLYETYQDYHGKDDPEILVWHADTRTMNPTITQELIDRETRKDPNSARSEWEAQFKEDVETFLDPEIIKACATVSGILGYQPYSDYQAFCDPSGGRADAFSLAIGSFKYNRKKFVVDLLKAWDPPFNPSGVVSEIKQILCGYRVNRITGDRYAADWVSEAFEKERISYASCEKTKSGLYLDFEGYINTGQVELPNDKLLITELTNLERRRGKSGKDQVDHPPRGQDDRANAVAGLCHLLTKQQDSAAQGLDLS
jgi:hypothetical protein